jgi:hypothetical protein
VGTEVMSLIVQKLMEIVAQESSSTSCIIN